MARLPLFLSLFIAASALAQTTITSITPSSGPVSGGTTVTIHGSGFDTTCTQCTAAWFAGVPATSTALIDANTIQAVTPPFAPVTVDVSVISGTRFATLSNGFTYVDANGDFERILLPIFTPPLTGSFGSQFFTFLSIWNTAGADIPVYAFPLPPCTLATCPSPPPGSLPIFLKARAGAPWSAFQFDGDPGRLLYVPKGAFDRLAASLRVTDMSRSTLSFGTRIPIVPEREFRSDFLALIDIPMTANFRNTLRIYSLDNQTSVHVRVINYDSTIVESEADVDLKDALDMFHPGYA